MPNFSACSIRITGSKSALAKFVKTLSKPNADGESVAFSFQQTVPIPIDCDEQEQRTSQRPFRIDEQIKKWGTKWDADQPEIARQSSTELLITCNTAWCPPLEWGKAVSELFPTLTFCIAYCECGGGFYGMWKRNVSKEETITKEYRLIEEDFEPVDEDDEDEMDSPEPSGRLKKFMDKYSVPHTGG
jgi:hypothetical protein